MSKLDVYIVFWPVIIIYRRPKSDKAAVIFLDEFPWIETHKSGFLQAFDHWWNTSASKKSHLKVIICGSAASWMIEKILNDRGELHNRVTQTIRLLPFTLGETSQYLKSKSIVLDQYSQLQLYMAIGGIPHYLRNVNPGESTAQIIDRLCFAKDGMLKGEFDSLYKSFFANSEHHEHVIRALARKGKGLTRNEIVLQIKRALGIEGVLTHSATWRHVPGKGEQGAQIDLLLDRLDRSINICEMKFANAEYVIDKKYAAELDNKVNIFRTGTKTMKTIFLTMITTFGTKKNEHYLGRIQAEVFMDDLFK